MYHMNMHLFNEIRAGKRIEGFINDKNVISYSGYCKCIKGSLSNNLLMISFTKVLMYCGTSVPITLKVKFMFHSCFHSSVSCIPSCGISSHFSQDGCLR